MRQALARRICLMAVIVDYIGVNPLYPQSQRQAQDHVSHSRHAQEGPG